MVVPEDRRQFVATQVAAGFRLRGSMAEAEVGCCWVEVQADCCYCSEAGCLEGEGLVALNRVKIRRRLGLLPLLPLLP